MSKCNRVILTRYIIKLPVNIIIIMLSANLIMLHFHIYYACWHNLSWKFIYEAKMCHNMNHFMKLKWTSFAKFPKNFLSKLWKMFKHMYTCKLLFTYSQIYTLIFFLIYDDDDYKNTSQDKLKDSIRTFRTMKILISILEYLYRLI